MATYDPDVIKEFADNLYARARGVIAAYTVGGFVIVGAVAFFIAVNIGTNTLEALPWIGGLMGGVLGFFSGRSKAFELKLKAQRALTQVEIVANTRKMARRLRRTSENDVAN